MTTTTEIPWGDGSGDKIYLTTDALEGDQTILVSSDANTGTARTKTVTFTASNSGIIQTLTVNQAAGVAPIFYRRLVFDGTAYIDTDIIPAEGSSFRVILGNETSKVAQRIFSVPCISGAQIAVILNSNTTSSRRYFSVYYGGTSSASSNRYLGWTNDEYSFFLTSKRFGWGSASYTFTKGSNNPSSGLIIGTNSSRSGTVYTGDIGVFRIYGSETENVSSDSGFNSYTPNYTLRPCTYNGEAGLWCDETNKFYGNTAGAGTLTVLDS